jgi:hypothetical protein
MLAGLAHLSGAQDRTILKILHQFGFFRVGASAADFFCLLTSSTWRYGMLLA